MNWLSLITNGVSAIKGIIFAFSKIGKFIKYLSNAEMVANAIATFLSACGNLWNAIARIKDSKYGRVILAIVSLIISILGVYVYAS